nr:transcription factor iws1 [Quercus suber]
MEDLEAAPGSPILQDNEEPQGNNDPGDILNPDIEEETTARTPPMGNPTLDTETFGDEEAPETAEAVATAEDEGAPGSPPNVDDDGEESELDDLDEEQFEDFDPNALNIPDKPIPVDADNVGLLGKHKRKRTEEEENERKKKKKEGRREKPKRQRKKRDDEDNFEGGVEVDGKRSRKSKAGAEGRPNKTVRRAKTPEDEESLTPDERRRRALDRKMDEALKSHRTVKRGKGIDLDAMADAELEALRQKMAAACEADAKARERGDPATQKLKVLPEVVEMLNRNTIQSQIVDPDVNILEAVRFMLEPADMDAALPNYQIQRELFAILSNLKMNKEALVASGIGKVVLFYTKSIQPQPQIRRQAEKLVGEWMRVVLNKGKDMSNRPVETRTFDPLASQAAARLQKNIPDRAAIAMEKRRRALAQPIPGNRARMEGGLGTYTVAPVNNLSNAGMGPRRAGAGASEEALRRMTGAAPRRR